MCVFMLMVWRTPISTRTVTLFPYTTIFRSVAVNVPALSEKYIADLRFALVLSVDFSAISFVRSAADADDVRRIMDEEGVHVPVIAKIEKPQAIENIDGIVKAFDGLMVARGDLGVECPLEDVPFLQKRLIEKARRNAKPVIVRSEEHTSELQTLMRT